MFFTPSIDIRAPVLIITPNSVQLIPGVWKTQIAKVPLIRKIITKLGASCWMLYHMKNMRRSPTRDCKVYTWFSPNEAWRQHSRWEDKGSWWSFQNGWKDEFLENVFFQMTSRWTQALNKGCTTSDYLRRIIRSLLSKWRPMVTTPKWQRNWIRS